MVDPTDRFIRDFRALARWQRWGPVCLVCVLVSAAVIELAMPHVRTPPRAYTPSIDLSDPPPDPSPIADSDLPRVAVGALPDGQTAWALEPRVEHRDGAWFLRDHFGVEQLEVALDDPDAAIEQLEAWARRICWDDPRPLYLVGFDDPEALATVVRSSGEGCSRLEATEVVLTDFVYCDRERREHHSPMRGWRNFPASASMCEL